MFDNLKEWLINDELPAKQLDDYKRNLDALIALERFGFGVKKKRKDRFRDIGMHHNPVPVNGVIGEYFYLNRLRSRKDGSRFLFHRLCYCVPKPPSPPFDIFELVSTSGKEWFDICLNPFSLKRTCAAPLNVKTESWDSIKHSLDTFKMGYGVRYFVPDFPKALPLAYSSTIAGTFIDFPNHALRTIQYGVPELKQSNNSDNIAIKIMLDCVQKHVDHILSETSALDDKYQYRNLDNFNWVALKKKDFKLIMAIKGR